MNRLVYRAVSAPPRLLYAVGLGGLIGSRVLLLRTVGRRTGELRTTPLQYERVDGAICIGSARGTAADWYRNLVADPRVEVRIGRSRFLGSAETITDSGAIADFLQLRLERHPLMIGTMLWAAGVGRRPSRIRLEEYGRSLALVTVEPSERTEAQPG